MKELEELYKRFWEIDFSRGFAIIMMITYHTLYFQKYFGGDNFNFSSLFWHIFQLSTATIFLFLVGVSLTLSYSRAKQEYKTERLFPKYCKRGLNIFSLGLCMTALTWVFLRGSYVRFGILHLIGVSIILAYPFLRLNILNLLIGILLVSLGVYFRNTTFDFPWLMWFAFVKEHYYRTVDYFPLMPWFGVTLIGMFFGKLLYPNCKRRINLADLSHFYIIKPFCFLGRHSLIIYFLHQPLLIGILYILGMARIVQIETSFLK